MSREEEPAPAVAAVPAAASRHTVGLHGAVVAFDPTNDDWSEYVERLEHYFTANDIVEGDKQRAILLNAVGASTYRLIRSLVSPSKVTDFSFAELVEKAKVHFNPKPSAIVKRYEFNTRCQGPDEAITSYVAELRKIAEYCDYKDVLKDMLRDRLVCETCNRAIQRRLLQETALTFELTPAYNFLKFTCNDVIAEWALPATFGEDGLLAFLGLALAHERSNATKTVTAAREEMAKTVYRGKSANSATRIG